MSVTDKETASPEELQERFGLVVRDLVMEVTQPRAWLALVATGVGLLVAIPAVIAYNRYSNDVERLINRYDNFLEEFSTILQRQAHV